MVNLFKTSAEVCPSYSGALSRVSANKFLDKLRQALAQTKKDARNEAVDYIEKQKSEKDITHEPCVTVRELKQFFTQARLPKT